MARIDIDPNYSAPTFPRATAATDLFKKEDVQSLAAAMSTHDHSAGKGVVVAIGAVPDQSINGSKILDGSISSAKIIDATIGTVDLAADIVTQRAFINGALANPTTTSTSMTNLDDMLINITTDTATDVLIELSGSFSASVKGAAITIAMQFDGAPDIAAVFGYAPDVTMPQVIGTRWLVKAVGTGAHTVRGRWAVSTGTATANSITRTLTVIAFKH